MSRSADAAVPRLPAGLASVGMEKRGLDHQDRTLLLSVADQVEAMGWPKEAERLRRLAQDTDPMQTWNLRGVLAGLDGLGGSLGNDVEYLREQTEQVLKMLGPRVSRNVVPRIAEDEFDALVLSIVERLDRMGLGQAARHVADGVDLSAPDSASQNLCLREALDEIRRLHWDRLGPELRDDIDRIAGCMESVARPNK